MPSDTEKNFQKLMQDPKHRSYFQSLGWDQPGAITYRINSEGFRGQEFSDPGDWFVALGCSFTMGIGLPESGIWPTLVAQTLGLNCANISWGGASADTCFRMAEYWIPQLKPHAVAMLTPPPDRLELLLHPDFAPPYRSVMAEVYMSQSLSQVFNPNDTYITNWLAESENSRLNNIKNKLAVRQICQDLGIPCAVFDAFDFMSGTREDLGYARDHMHGGLPAHKKITEYVLNVLKTQ